MRFAEPFAFDFLLFDIDGTLVRRAGPHHRLALIEAVRRVTGVDTTTDGVPVHGMLDPDILTTMMRKARMSDQEIALNMPAVIECAERLRGDSARDPR